MPMLHGPGNAQLLAVLPIPEVYIEDEEHILFSCQFFQNIRDQAHPHLKALLATNDSSRLFGDTNATTLLARYAKIIAKGLSDKTGCKRCTTRITRTMALPKRVIQYPTHAVETLTIRLRML